jgi:ABC-type nitrate/sulfonate/bicarbonate transport system substrate-binding protein
MRLVTTLTPALLAGLVLTACGGQPGQVSASSSASASASAGGLAQGQASASAKPAVSAASQASASSQKLALKVAYTTTTPAQAPLWAAKEGGDFDAEGLDVTLSRIVSGAPVMGALQNGEVPFAITGAQQIVQAGVQGGQFVMIAGFIDKLLGSIWGISSIQNPAQLKGKAVGVTSFGSSSQLSAIAAFKKLGVEGVEYVATGGPPETLAAFNGGKIQAAPFQPPDDLRALALGLHEIISVAALDIKTSDSMLTSTRKYVQERPDVAERFVRAVIKATAKLRTDQAFARQVYQKYVQIDDPAALQHASDYFHDKYTQDGSISSEGLQHVIDTVADSLPSAKGAKPEQFIDTSFLQKIKSSGLIDQLYKS